MIHFMDDANHAMFKIKRKITTLHIKGKIILHSQAEKCSHTYLLLISNFHHVLNVVCFFLGNSLASEFYTPMFQNTLSVPSSYLPAYEDGTQCSKTLEHKIQTLGNYSEESINILSWVRQLKAVFTLWTQRAFCLHTHHFEEE